MPGITSKKSLDPGTLTTLSRATGPFFEVVFEVEVVLVAASEMRSKAPS
jgi:hypothetical protein